MSQLLLDDKSIRTDLIREQDLSQKESKIIYNRNNIKVLNDIKSRYHYSTIYFNDITDGNNYNNLKNIVKKELSKYIEVDSKNSYLIIGLGNSNSTPDSLGPKTINKILVTRYLYKDYNISSDYSNVAAYNPNVSGNTGIE